MTFSPSAGQTIVIESATYRFVEDPAAPVRPYRIEGQRSIVYQLARQDGRLYALKVFAAAPQAAVIVAHSRLIGQHSQLPGLQACARTVIVLERHQALLQQHPELAGGILMPWAGDATWHDTMRPGTALTPVRSHGLALSLARTLAAMEPQKLTHGALGGPHVLISDNPSTIELVSLEHVSGPGLPVGARTSDGPVGYTHRSAQGSSWSPAQDRFAGAILLAEILGWCDPQVLAARAGDHYFDPAELQMPCPRYRILATSLGSQWGGEVVRMLATAWHSSSPTDCPPAIEWARLLEGLPVRSLRPIARPLEANPASRVQQAQAQIEASLALARLGQLDQSIDRLTEAYSLFPAVVAPHLTRLLQQRARTGAQSGDLDAALSDCYAAQLVAPSDELRAEVAAAIATIEQRIAAGDQPGLADGPGAAPAPTNADAPELVEHTAAESDPSTAPDGARPDNQRPLSPRVLIALLFAALGLLCAALLLFMGDGLSPVIASPTIPAMGPPTAVQALATPTAVAGSPTISPTAPVTASPEATQTPERVVTVESGVNADPSQVPAVAITVSTIEPGELLTGDLSDTLTIRGQNLERVTSATLVSPDREPIPLILLGSVTRNELQLRLASPDASIRTDAYILALNGDLISTTNILVIATRPIIGLTAENAGRTSRIGEDAQGYFTLMRVQPDAMSERIGSLRNDDQVEVLDESNPNWYQVRIRKSSDPRQANIEGWIERWFLDVGAAPEPTLTPASTPVPQPTAVPARLRFRLLNYNDAPGCITVQIRGVNTTDWFFKADGMNPSGSFDYSRSTGSGNARLCGLGADQEVTITVYNSSRQFVLGGRGVPSKGRAIMVADWR